ncbi:MAG TPA: SAM-dependent methyltransferase [Methyloceanibacter sp.]|nr:SAM-dependent methyltransferase [Methyloceanibacter sp.]
MADLAGAAEAGACRAVMGALSKAGTIGAQALASRLRDRIAREGSISVHDYMEACLGDRRSGYYATREPIGASGDFITAPEISQTFGELIGVWCVAVSRAMPAPAAVTVAELGPGRGTLIADALRAWRSAPEFLALVSVALVETSSALEAVQRETLRASPAPCKWYASLDDIPPGPLILIANEFIDALPLRQFVRQGGAWRERTVALTGDALGFGAGAPAEQDALPSWLSGVDAEEGAIVETRPAAAKLVAMLAARANDAPVAALIADYGPARSGIGDTLQAVRRHRFADPLAAQGETDLTGHVDFTALSLTARAAGLAAFGPMPQGQFLLELGLAARVDRLSREATPAEREAILSGAARLADPRQMGALFKMLALQSSGLAPPPPFGEI